MNTISFESGRNALMNHRFFSVKKAELLLAAKSGTTAKNVINGDLTPEQKASRATSFELLNNSCLNRTDPLVAVSVRNVLSNLRCLAYREDLSLMAVQGEDIDSARSYFCLGYTTSRKFEIREMHITKQSSYPDYKWFISGVPVIWDGMDDTVLFDAILSEAADHSHVFFLPRGNHPLADDETKRIWKDMHFLFENGSHLGREELAGQLALMAEKNSLKRESSYLHNVLGLDPEGNLVQLADRDLLENLGKRLKKEYGVTRAICVDNGGSVEVSYFPHGIDSPGFMKCEFGHRPEGTAYIGFALGSNLIRT